MNLRTHVRKSMVAVAVVTSLGLGSSASFAAPQEAAARHTVEAPSATTDASTSAASWVVYDGFKITSATNCNYRKASLEKNYPNDRFMCKKFTIPQCPTPYVYWLIMIDEYRRTSLASDLSALPDSGNVALAC